MNKLSRQEFMTELIKELRNIEASELQNVLQYYNEYFDEAGAENEQAVIEELGSPKSIAAGIRSNVSMRYLETGKSNAKKSLKAVWISIGAIFAAPIAFPLAIAFAALAVAIVITFGALMFSLFMVSFSFALCAVLLVFLSFGILFVSPAAFMVAFGVGLVCGGLSILFFIPTLTLTRRVFKDLALFINRKILRGKTSDE